MAEHVVTVPDDATIAYETVGDGPVVVLVHGITERRAAWGQLADRFAESGRRVLAVDLRGHGDSSRTPPYDLATMAADVGAVLAADEAADPLMVGHSLGGAVVSAYASGGPCRGVVNVDQPLALGDFQGALRELEPLLRGTPEECGAAVSTIFEHMAGPLAGAERARIDALRDAEQDVVLGIWDLVLTSEVTDLDAVVDAVAAGISAPYLSLHGIDPGPGYAGWLAARIAGATVETWPEHGHYPHLVDPDRFVERVLEFDRPLTLG